MGHETENVQLWTYDELMDRAYQAAHLARLSQELSARLVAISQAIPASHQATAQWIRQLGDQLAREAAASQGAGADRTRPSLRRFAHRLEQLCELVQQLLRDADSLAAPEWTTLTQQLHHVWNLASHLDGLDEPHYATNR